jgi:glutamate synthase domain-containing protein 1
MGNFVKYYLQKALHESGELSDVIVSGVRNYIALLEQQNIDIFTDELKESLKNNFDVFKVIVSDDIDLFESFKFLIESGSDFHEALDLIGFDPFSVIKRVC